MAFDLGDVVPLTVDITDAAGAPANAGAVVLTVTLPDGTTATPSVTNPTTGRYQVDYPTVQAGRHLARWVATGANASAFTDQFDVRPADPGYIISLADAKAHLNRTTGASPDDDELRRFMAAATQRVERWTGRVTARRTETTRVNVCGTDTIWLHHRPILSLTSIATIDGLTTWPVTSTYVYLDAEMGMIRRLSGNWWTGDLLITYVAGMTVIPDDQADCALEILEARWNTQRLPGFGRAPSQDQGIPVRTVVTDDRMRELLGPPGLMVA